MLELYQAFKEIKANPVILANSSIYSLDAYITAYDDFCRAWELPLTEQQQEFRLFLNWLRFEKYQKTTTKNVRWSSLILYDSDNERDALNNFFELFDEFRALKNSQKQSNISPN
jgi:hypothetical protein